MDLILPQGRFTFAAADSDAVVLVAGGRPPSSGWLAEVAKHHRLWAVDRGIEVCRQASLIPELLLGDADSGSAESWRWAQTQGVPVVRHPVDKDLTDLQLALRELSVRQPGAAALVAGGLGGRFDHAYSNVFSLIEAQRYGITPAGFIDGAEVLFLLQDGQVFEAAFTDIPPAISLLPLSARCENVCSQGLNWPLEAATLFMDRPGGICNRLAVGSRVVKTSLGRGCMGVYICWDEQHL